MSKAFTRESDDTPDLPILRRPSSSLPPGVPNYVTPDGAQRLRDELERLVQVERPALQEQHGADEIKERLQRLDLKIRQLEEILQSIVIVPPPSPGEEHIRFGATVAVRDSSGEESCYRIVGVDETDIDRGWISWLSPLAKALLNARVGDRVRFRLPAGERELEILRVRCETGGGD